MKPTHLLDGLTMAVLNLSASAILALLHLVNALYGFPNLFVTFAAPLGAAVFLVLSAVWFLELARRTRAHRFAPYLRPRELRAMRLSAHRLIAIPHALSHRGTLLRRWARIPFGRAGAERSA